MGKYIAVIVALGAAGLILWLIFGMNNSRENTSAADSANEAASDPWKAKLTPLQYKVTRQHGTERAFTGKYWDHKEDGIYKCVCCGKDLFDSKTKFKSGTGWPSFFDIINDKSIAESEDTSLPWEKRTEVTCGNCDAHLGHVFPDGPAPTGLRYCVNSAALVFEKRK